MFQEEGPGWRLVRDSSRSNFPILIGGEGWAFELTEDEGYLLAQVIFELSSQHQKLQDQLMPEETIRLEMERQPWWGCLDGDKDCWSLQVICQHNGSDLRAIEAQWPAPAAESISKAMRMMWDSFE